MEADTTIRAKRAASLNDTTETRSQKKPKSEPPAPQDGALGVEGLRVGSDSDIQVLPAGGLDDSTESTISQNRQRKSQESAMTQEAISSCVDQVKHYVRWGHPIEQNLCFLTFAANLVDPQRFSAILTLDKAKTLLADRPELRKLMEEQAFETILSTGECCILRVNLGLTLVK